MYIEHRRIAKAARGCALPVSQGDAPVVFSEGFEARMDAYFRSRRRIRAAGTGLRWATAAVVLVLAVMVGINWEVWREYFTFLPGVETVDPMDIPDSIEAGNPIRSAGSQTYRYARWERAAQFYEFPILRPSYIPDGYTLSFIEVRYAMDGRSAPTVAALYEHSEGINYSFGARRVLHSNYAPDDYYDTVIRETVGGVEYTYRVLIEIPEPRYPVQPFLSWHIGNTLYNIASPDPGIDRDTMMAIAMSLEPVG